MEVIYKSCCGIDVHKNKLVACLKVKGKKNVIKEFSGQTEDIKIMANWLKENKCEKIAMESTASYWKPLVNVFEIMHLEYTIINAIDYKNLPGKKTDVKDSEWIADLLQHGMLRDSFIPSAQAAEKRKDTFFYAQYQRISMRRGKKKAILAVAHSILIAIYYMIKEDKEFVNLGSDFYNKFNKEKKANAYIKKLKELGYDVQLDIAQVS